MMSRVLAGPLRQFGLSTAILALGTLCLWSEAAEETVFFDVPQNLVSSIPEPTAALLALPGYPDDENRLTLAGALYLPDANTFGPGPYPAVVMMHGSGGLWSNDIIANGPASQFESWGEELSALGYLVLFPDSYNPRGIPGNFSSRRPHWDPAIDDDVCSPNYERPKDIVAALTYLGGRNDVDPERVALVGWSHGAQTVINGILDASVDLGNYQVSSIDQVAIPDTNPVEFQNVSGTRAVPSPVRIPNWIPFPRLCVAYYGGGSHYGYHGQASSTAAGRYMFDRRTRVLMFHGTSDSLFSGSQFPARQALASSAQAAVEGVSDPLMYHFLLDGVGHSFDGTSPAPPEDWNTPDESPDQKARRLGREEVLKWLEACLKPAPTMTIAHAGPGIHDYVLQVPATNNRLRYQWRDGDLFSPWVNFAASFDGTGNLMELPINLQSGELDFFQLRYGPIPPPFDDPNHAGFFRTYADFGL